MLPDGHYFVKLDEKYKKMDLNDFEVTIMNGKFVIKLSNKVEILGMDWIDDNSFIVKGYTEPKTPNSLEQKLFSNSKQSFNITKQIDSEYYFTLGVESDNNPVFSGKFIKSNQKK